MQKQIVAIRLKLYFRVPGDSTENIDQVKLETGEVQYVREVALHITGGDNYYFTTDGGSTKTEVAVVYNSTGTLYIRTKANQTIKDNLLSLPKF